MTSSASVLLSGPSYNETRGVAAGSLDMREYINETKSTSSQSRYPPEIRINHSDNINLEHYNTSPRKYQESIISTFNRTSQCSTDYYTGNRSTFGNEQIQFNVRDMQNQASQSPAISPECSAKVLCSADIESRMSISAMPDVTLATTTEIELLNSPKLISREHANVIPDIASTGERKQPDGEEKNPEITITDCENTTTGMLDRISHDLDYLLNRTQTTEET